MRNNVVGNPAAAIEVLEAAHAESSDLAAWTNQVAEAARKLFRNDSAALTLIERGREECRQANMGRSSSGVDAVETYTDLFDLGVQAADVVHRVDRVESISSLLRKEHCAPAIREWFHGFLERTQCRDAVGINGHVGRFTFSLFTMLSDVVSLTRTERMLLQRVGMHIEQALRLRLGLARSVARVDPTGRVVETSEGIVFSREREKVGHHVRAVEASRSADRRSDVTAIEVWTGLVRGRYGLIERGPLGRRYYEVLENPAPTETFCEFTPRESNVVELAAQGVSNKLIAYGLGVSQASVTRALQSAASKVGCAGPSDLVRVSSILLYPRSEDAWGEEPTAAELEVLELVRAGFSNAEIAACRKCARSTVANHVASLLRKAQVPSRRGLVTSRAGPPTQR